MDLLQETVVRFLDGKRNWPRGELFKAVFYNAIRSIADEFRSEEAAKPYVSVADLPLGEMENLQTWKTSVRTCFPQRKPWRSNKKLIVSSQTSRRTRMFTQ